MKIDFPFLAAGVRTAAALLIGNSVLVFTGVLGVSLPDAFTTALKIFIIGCIGLLVTSVIRNKK